MAIEKKIDCKKHLMLRGGICQNYVRESDEISSILRMANALEYCSNLESAMLAVGVNGDQDLAIP